MNSNCETYTVRYNETTGIIEVLDVLKELNQSLKMEKAPVGIDKDSTGRITMREAIISNCNMFDSILKDCGYSSPVSPSFSDSENPDKILLTAYDGEIIHDIAE